MDFREALSVIRQETENVLKEIKEEEVEGVVRKVLSSPQIFLYGEGRTGLLGKTFAIRLRHLELKAFFAGEPLNPPFQQGSLFLALSGSGETERVVSTARKAKTLEGEVICITGRKNSPLARIAHKTIILPGTMKVSPFPSKTSSQPLNSLFEQSLFLFLEAVILLLYKHLGPSEEELQARHFNL